MRVTVDLAANELLGRREVVRVRVDERARLHVLDRHLHREGLVRLDGVAVLREDELGGGHVVGRGDDTDRSGVA